MQVALEDPKRFRIEMTFSRGADLSPLEVTSICDIIIMEILLTTSCFCFALSGRGVSNWEFLENCPFLEFLGELIFCFIFGRAMIARQLHCIRNTRYQLWVLRGCKKSDRV